MKRIIMLVIILMFAYMAFGAAYDHRVHISTDPTHDSSSIVLYRDGVLNDSSVVAKLTSGESSFLFTGDLPAESEEEFLHQAHQHLTQAIHISIQAANLG